jgi:hypothetical protein
MSENEMSKKPLLARGHMLVANPGMALVVLFAVFAFFLILTPILSGLIGRLCSKPEAAIRISIVLQDVLAFVLPAVVMAVVATRLPARLLAVDKKPKLLTVLLAFATLVCATPAMNAIIEWNANWHLPEAFSGFEALMRQMEDAAQTVTDQLMAKSTVPSLIVSILIVGVLAGFSEELFFRGAMQRLFGEMGMNKHVAVWSVALIFSVMHFQFFGFVPRMLLGVFLGYLLVWSRSLWVPMIIHIINNSIVVFTTWREVNEPEAGENFNTIGSDLTNTGDVMLVIGSVIVTVVLLYALYKTNRQNLES